MSARDVNISIDTDELAAQLYKLKNVKNGAKKAVTRGLNRAVAKMKTDSKKAIKDEYLITKMSSVTKSFMVDSASYSDMSAAFKSNGRPIALTYFVYSRNRFPRVKGTPTAFAVVKKRDGGYTGGFVAKMKSGHIGIFKRVKPGDKDYDKMRARSKMAEKYKTRYPIKQLYGPSATELLNNEAVKAKISETAVLEFNKEFNRQVDYLFKGGK